MLEVNKRHHAQIANQAYYTTRRVVCTTAMGASPDLQKMVCFVCTTCNPLLPNQIRNPIRNTATNTARSRPAPGFDKAATQAGHMPHAWPPARPDPVPSGGQAKWPCPFAPQGPWLYSPRPPRSSRNLRHRRQVLQALARHITAAHIHATGGAAPAFRPCPRGCDRELPAPYASGSRTQQAEPAPTPKTRAAPFAPPFSDTDRPYAWLPPSEFEFAIDISVARNPGRGQPAGRSGRFGGPAAPPLAHSRRRRRARREGAGLAISMHCFMCFGQ